MSRLKFVWPYWHDGAHYDELRWSMRSVLAWFDGTADVLVVGDRPPWYSGPIIERPRLTTGRSFRHGLADALAKWLAALEVSEDAELVWMMDDVFFLKPFSRADIEPGRAKADISLTGTPSNGFRTKLQETAKALAAAGLPHRNYATHAPHLVDRREVLGLFERFPIVSQGLNWEVIYRNVMADRGQAQRRVGPWFTYVSRGLSDSQAAILSDNATCITAASGAWNEALRRLLFARLPEQPAFESVAPKPPKASKIKPESTYTPWGAGWTCHNGKAAEIEFIEFLASLVKLHRPQIVIETGVGRGYSTKSVAGACKGVPESLLVGYESDAKFRKRSGVCGALISSLPSPTAEQMANADLVILDSETPRRIEEITLWHHHARPGSTLIVHDVSDRHEEGKIHRQLFDHITALGIPGTFLKNPRGGFLATRPGHPSTPPNRRLFTKSTLYMP